MHLTNKTDHKLLLLFYYISRIIFSGSVFRLQQLIDYIYSYIVYYTTLKELMNIISQL